MRPEDVIVSSNEPAMSVAVPIDVELEALDVELEAAGVRTRRTLNGQIQPTRYFSIQLRQHLLQALDAGASGAARRETPGR
jgi:hypothetical protein